MEKKELAGKELEDAKKLAKRLIEDFSDKVKKEEDSSVILLKAHLLIEHYIDDLIVLLYDAAERVDNRTFKEKLDLLKAKKVFDNNIQSCLYKVNRVRNSLSHDLNFCLSVSDIDLIGYFWGADYIYRKYECDKKKKEDVISLFIWVIEKVLWSVFFPIFSNILKNNRSTRENESKD